MFKEFKENPPIAGHIVKLMQFLVEEVQEWDEEAADEIEDLFLELLEKWGEEGLMEEGSENE